MQYQNQDLAAPNYYTNHGNEAGAYLQYIVDRYDCLPTVRPWLLAIPPSPITTTEDAFAQHSTAMQHVS